MTVQPNPSLGSGDGDRITTGSEVSMFPKDMQPLHTRRSRKATNIACIVNSTQATSTCNNCSGSLPRSRTIRAGPDDNQTTSNANLKFYVTTNYLLQLTTFFFASSSTHEPVVWLLRPLIKEFYKSKIIENNRLPKELTNLCSCTTL